MSVTGSAVNLSLGTNPATPGVGGSSIGWASVNRNSLTHTAAAVAPGSLTVTRADLNAAAIAAVRAAERDPLVQQRGTAQSDLAALRENEPPKYAGQAIQKAPGAPAAGEASSRGCGKLRFCMFSEPRKTMAIPLEALESQVLQLPTADRIRLLDRVVASLDADATRDAAWDAVAAARDRQAENDPTLLIPLDDALVRLRAELK